MSIRHHVDDKKRLIITIVKGKASDNDFIEALNKYQADFKSKPEYSIYNEVVDFSNLTDISLTSNGLRSIALVAKKTDQPEHKTKLALIVTSSLAFGLARMYQACRSLDAAGNKEVGVFKASCDAFEWVES